MVAAELVPEFPVEFLVEGTPVSAQSPNSDAKNEWKARVKEASYTALPESHWATDGSVAVTLFYFPAAQMSADLDNASKLVLDALSKHVYMDDRQVERLVVQKFEPGNVFPFKNPTTKLQEALSHPKPVLYVRISDRPFEDLS
jgi:crossover junction endodeoxyribonuclease RusA